MFNKLPPAATGAQALESLQDPIDTVATENLEDTSDLEAATESLIAGLEELDLAHVEFSALEDTHSVAENLDNLHATVTEFGYTKPLASLADAGKFLSSAITTFPAMEALAFDLVPESDETKAALEGLSDTIKETMVRWAKHAYEAAAKGLSAAAKVAGGWAIRFAEIARKSAGRVFSEKKAEETHAAHGTPSASMLEKIMKMLAEIPGKLKAMWTKAEPEAATEGLDEIYLGALENFSEMEKEVEGAEKDGGGKTLHALGYTKAFAEKIMKFAKGFAGSTIPAFFKSLVEHVKRLIGKVAESSPEKASAMRHAIAAMLKHSWAAIRGVYLRGLSMLHKAAAAVFASSEIQAEPSSN
jgi:hypothetical protein